MTDSLTIFTIPFTGTSGHDHTVETLSIAVGGRVIGAYNYVLAPQQRADVANFTI